MADTNRLRFFDCNATLGRPASPTFGSWLSRRSLLAEMEQLGIDEALVAHVHGQEIDGDEGNRSTIQATSESPRLHAQATLFPRFGPEAKSQTDAELDALVRAGFVAVRVHPNPTHHIMDANIYPGQLELTPTAMGRIFSGLEARRIPLFVELAQTTWGELDELCRAYPRLEVVVTNVSYTAKRAMFSLLASVPNIAFDTSGFHAYRGIEEVCETFGATRLLFGTRLPAYNALPAKALITFADIGDEDRRAIAGGNLARLLAGKGS